MIHKRCVMLQPTRKYCHSISSARRSSPCLSPVEHRNSWVFIHWKHFIFERLWLSVHVTCLSMSVHDRITCTTECNTMCLTIHSTNSCILHQNEIIVILPTSCTYSCSGMMQILFEKKRRKKKRRRRSKRKKDEWIFMKSTEEDNKQLARLRG